MVVELEELKQYILNKNWEKASGFIREYESKVSADNFTLKYYILKGKVLERKNLGQEWWKQGLKSFPKNVHLNRKSVNGLIKANKFEDALNAIDTAISIILPVEDFFHRRKIELYIKLDEREKALESSKIYNSHFTNDSYGIFREIHCLLLLKRRESAIKLFNKRIQLLEPRHLLEIHFLLNQYNSIVDLCKEQIAIGDEELFWLSKLYQAQILSSNYSLSKYEVEKLAQKAQESDQPNNFLLPLLKLDSEVERHFFNLINSSSSRLPKSLLKYQQSIGSIKNKEREITYRSSVDKRVDLVYTWVDMSDPNFLERFKDTNGFYPKSDDNFQQSEIRYTNHGEIKFSLRTVQEYFSEVNHIFIVTNSQSFDLDFLNSDFKSKITFVNQEEIIPKDLVESTTFNSNLIETFIWRIPNLSETFLYFCDDYFLGNYLDVDKHIFDSNGIPYALVMPYGGLNLTFDKALLDYAKEKTKYRAFNYNAHRLYEKVIGNPPKVIDLHLPMLLRKKACKEAFSHFSSHWKKAFYKNALRKNSCFYTLLMFNWYALDNGYQRVGPYHEYKRNSLIFNNGLSEENYKILTEKRPLFFCINFLPDLESKSVFQKLSEHYLSTI